MNERQKRRVFGVESSVPITVNPVPVHPDMASKMLSVQLMWTPITNGRAPTTAMASQMSATAARATEICGTYSLLGMRDMRRPRSKNVSGTEASGTTISHSSNINSTTKGTRVITPRNLKMIPMSWAMTASVSSRFMMR